MKSRSSLTLCIALCFLLGISISNCKEPTSFTCQKSGNCPENYKCINHPSTLSHLPSGRFCHRECEHAGDCFGEETCTTVAGEGTTSVCLPCPNHRAEICNKKDDDCDGLIDEGLQCKSPPQPGDWKGFTVGGVSFGMRWVPPGSFVMGSPSTEPERSAYEGPQHEVTFTQGFWMMETEVTQAQFKAVMGYNPSRFTTCGGNCPVEHVSWHEAAHFANKLSQKTGLGTGCFSCSGKDANLVCQPLDHKTYSTCKGWKLPTEAQWEYAARAGTTTARYGNLNDIAWYTKTTNDSGTKPVKGKLPNQWKLYDILGNVYEWTYDYHAKYSFGAVLNPVGPSTGSNRVVRGGCWLFNARDARAAYRLYVSPGYRNFIVGLRLLRDDLP